MPTSSKPYSYYLDLLDKAVENQDNYSTGVDSLQKFGDHLHQPFDQSTKDYDYYLSDAKKIAEKEVSKSSEDPDLLGFVPGEWLPDWVKAGYNNSLEGLGRQLISGKKRWDVAEDAEENFGFLEDVGSTVVSFLTLTDTGAMFAGGGIGGFALKNSAALAAKQAIKAGLKQGAKKKVKVKLAGKLEEAAVKKLVDQNKNAARQILQKNANINEKLAQQVVDTASKRVTNALMKEQAVSGATGLGFYSGLQSGLGQKVQTGDVDFVRVLADASKGAILGTVASVTASGMNSHLINKLGKPKTSLQKLANSTAIKTIEAAEFGTLQPALEGKMPQWKDYAHAAGVIGGLTVTKNIPKYAKKLTNLENPKLNVDQIGKEIGSAEFDALRKNDIFKNKKGVELTNVEFSKKKVKLSKEQKDQGLKEYEYDIVKAKDNKTGEKVELSGKDFAEQGFNRTRRTSERKEVDNKRRQETFLKMKRFLKFNNEDITKVVNDVRVKAGKDLIKPEKGKTGYGSLSEIERIKMLDYIRKLEHIEKVTTGLKMSGANDLMIPQKTVFSKIIPDFIKQAKNRVTTDAGLRIIRSINKVDISGATRVGTYLQRATEAGLNTGGFFSRLFGKVSVEVPKDINLQFLQKNPKLLSKTGSGGYLLKLKSKKQTDEYYKNLSERLENPNRQKDADVVRYREILNDVFKDAKKVFPELKYIKNFFPHMVLPEKIQKIAQDILTITSASDAFESVKLKSQPRAMKELVKTIESLKEQGKLSKETLEALAFLEKGYTNIKNKDLKTVEAFIRLRREQGATFTKAGSIDNARTKKDLPRDFYETDTRIVLTKYLSDVAQRIEYAKEFGRNGEKFEGTIAGLRKLESELALTNPAKALQVSKEISAIDKIYKIGFSLAETDPRFNYSDPRARKALKVLVDFEVATKIGLGYATIPNITQTLISTAVKAGYWNTLKGGVKMALPGKKGQEYRRELNKSGLSQFSVFQMLMGLEPSDNKMGKFAHLTTKISGFQAMNKFNQYLSAAAGREYVNSLLKARNSKLIGRRNWAKESLRDLDINPKSKTISEKQLFNAMYKFSRDAQLQRNVLNDPIFANDPRYRPFFLFKRFGLKQFNWIRENLSKELGRGNVLPLLRLGVGGMFGAQFVTWSKKALNNLLSGEDVTYDETRVFIPFLPPGTPLGTFGSDVNTDMSKYTWGDFLDHISSVGALGFIGDIVASESKFRALEFLFKPAIAQDALKAIDALQRITKDIGEYGALGSLERSPKYLAPLLGTAPRRISKRFETKGQKETYTRYRKGIIKGRILDALIDGNSGQASRMILAWNRANKRDAFYIEDINVEAIYDRLRKKAEKRRKP